MSKELQEIVERAVAHALERLLPKLQSELVESVLAELPAPAAGPEGAAAGPMPGGLVQAVASIHAGSTQKEILKALLDAGTSYASRVALFVVKGGAATGWQARGLGDDAQIKDFPLDMTAGPASHAYQNRVATPANIAEMDRRFVKQFGGPSNEQIVILPLVLKDKVAALLYADGGSENVLDAGSLEVLVMATSPGEVARWCKGQQKKAEPCPAPCQLGIRSRRRRPSAHFRIRLGAYSEPLPRPRPEPEPRQVVEWRLLRQLPPAQRQLQIHSPDCR
jgi:hypothetical protein